MVARSHKKPISRDKFVGKRRGQAQDWRQQREVMRVMAASTPGAFHFHAPGEGE